MELLVNNQLLGHKCKVFSGILHFTAFFEAERQKKAPAK